MEVVKEHVTALPTFQGGSVRKGWGVITEIHS